MNITFLQSYVLDGVAIGAGQTATVLDSVGYALINQGIAVVASGSTPPSTAVVAVPVTVNAATGALLSPNVPFPWASSGPTVLSGSALVKGDSLAVGAASTGTPGSGSAVVGVQGLDTGGSAGGVFAASAPTQAAIVAAVALAVAAGGGVVLIPPGTITLTSSLMLYPGVVYQGAGFNFPGSGQYPPNQVTQGTKGTVLVCGSSAGAGTFPAFWDGKSDLGSPLASTALFQAAYIFGTGVKNVQIVNASHGVKVGGYQNAAVAWSEFRNITTVGCGWGFYSENMDSSIVSNIYAGNYSNGAFWHMASASPYGFNCGDSYLERLIYSAGSITTAFSRNCVIGARNASNSNGLQINNIGGVGTACPFTTLTCTLPTGGSTITITGGSGTGPYTTASLAVGMPISLSAPSTGSNPVLNQQQIYFVQSILSSSTFTVSDFAFATTAKTFTTGVAGVPFIVRGWPGLELVGYDTSNITGLTMENIGCESSGTTCYLLQNITAAGGASKVEINNSLGASTGVTAGQQNVQIITTRGCIAGMYLGMMSPATSVDFDAGGSNFAVYGSGAGQYIQGYTGIGAVGTAGTNLMGTLSLSGFNSSKGLYADVWHDAVGGILRTQRHIVQGNGPNYPFGVSTNSNSAIYLGPNNGVDYSNGLSGATYAINLTINSDNLLGIEYICRNRSGGNQTVNTTTGAGGSLNITGVVPGTTTAVSATSVTLPNNTNMRIRASKTPAGVYEWAIV